MPASRNTTNDRWSRLKVIGGRIDVQVPFAYIESDIPAGMTIHEYRMNRPSQPSLLRRTVGYPARERLQSLGAMVKARSSRIASKLEVRTASERSIEAFESTQRVGGHVFW